MTYATVWRTAYLTSDGHRAYLEAVEGAFGGDVDYAQLVKLYGAAPESFKGRYSPANCIGNPSLPKATKRGPYEKAIAA